MPKMDSEGIDLNTDKIREWRSIVTLIVFVITNIIVLFPFHIPIYFPRAIGTAVSNALVRLRVTAPVSHNKSGTFAGDDGGTGKVKPWVRYNFPLNFLTAPLIADLFLLAILAIGRDEVYGGTISADNIEPLEILIFFITLAYIAISIDASGLIRFLAFKVLQKGGKVGHRLFFYLYSFFFVLGSFVGNDPIILSGTAFLAYMTRVSSNIVHPRAWIHTQFAVANIASAILVSSNPTNLVLAGAFGIKFFIYTANMVVPVVVTSIVLFPFLLYIVFADEALIPSAIKMHELPEEAKGKKPVNPNIPHARGTDSEEENSLASGDQTKLLSLEEIMNPFLDKSGATAGAVIMAATLICILLINALSDTLGHQPVYYVTLPAAVLMLLWDLAFGWLHREETRSIAREGRSAVEYARTRRDIIEQDVQRMAVPRDEKTSTVASDGAAVPSPESNEPRVATEKDVLDEGRANSLGLFAKDADGMEKATVDDSHPVTSSEDLGNRGSTDSEEQRARDLERRVEDAVALKRQPGPTTLSSLTRDATRWTQETFPTVAAVAAHLPVALVPFSFCMFVLVQALVSKGWVAVFAYGWTHWVDKTGTIGAIGGMAFVSVIMCNFAGTNIGTTILLCRIIQHWVAIHEQSGQFISDRKFWATVYSMALGVNYGAFSIAFSASLAGLLWRDILARKHIRVREVEFARVNLPIIAMSMVVGCVVLVGEVYIMRSDTTPYVK